jgi:hypothetical protein
MKVFIVITILQIKNICQCICEISYKFQTDMNIFSYVFSAKKILTLSVDIFFSIAVAGLKCVLNLLPFYYQKNKSIGFLYTDFFIFKTLNRPIFMLFISLLFGKTASNRLSFGRFKIECIRITRHRYGVHNYAVYRTVFRYNLQIYVNMCVNIRLVKKQVLDQSQRKSTYKNIQLHFSITSHSEKTKNI